MPDLLLELLSEEIPARMQARAAADLQKLVTDALVAQGYLYEGAVAFATPRRLALHVAGLPGKGTDQREERRGPRVGAPDAALTGFLKSAGVASPDQVKVVSDGKKGEYYVATIEKPGRPTPQVLSEILPPIIRSFPWPKSMRWGAASREPGSLRWVRPLQSILCTFGNEGEETAIVPLIVDGLVSGDVTRGHRFLAPSPIRARRFDDYVAALADAKVILDGARRRETIRHDARDLAFAQGLEVVEDEGLLDEVIGLVEWPVVLLGQFEESFLGLPPEVIRATIRANQKCFVLRPAGGGAGLANRFALVANIEASDGGAAIVAGNERVVRARLADAQFFWDTDRKAPLESRLPKLDSIVFHEKLGSQGERVKRIAALARELAPLVSADPDQAERAARLAKADLVTEMVGEFPELQGLMGRYYALAQGEPEAVANAVADHYRPMGPSDRVPTEPVSVAVALADKLDTLVGFWAIGETPTGSKDPYSLRRAALGVIRIVLENAISLPMASFFNSAHKGLVDSFLGRSNVLAWGVFEGSLRRTKGAGSLKDTRQADRGDWLLFGMVGDPEAWLASSDRSLLTNTKAGIHEYIGEIRTAGNILASLLAFGDDRLKVYLRDRGARHDLIDAVLAAGATPAPHAEVAGAAGPRSTQDGRASSEAPGPSPGAPQDEDGRAHPGSDAPGPSSPRGTASAPPPAALEAAGGRDDLLAVVRRVEALGAFLATDDGANLLAATKRASNILRIEEAKDGRSYDDMPELTALQADEEKALAIALARAAAAASAAVGRDDYAAAMAALAELRPAVDSFFDKVTVNADDPGLRENRLKLLAMLRRATREVADFSRIEG